MKYLHTMVRVTDLDASLRFYRDALGLNVIRQNDYPQGRFTLVYLAAPGDEAAQVELTHNWDPEVYTGGRNFGHQRRQLVRRASSTRCAQGVNFGASPRRSGRSRPETHA